MFLSLVAVCCFIGLFAEVNGATFREVTGLGSIGGWTSTSMSSSGDRVSATVYTGGIFYGSSSGNSYYWGQSGAPYGLRWYDVAMSSDGQYQVAAAYGDRMYYSSNYGYQWTATGYTGSYRGVATSASGRYVIALEYGQNIKYSSDYGHSYSGASSNYGYWTDVSMDASGQYAVAVFGGIYYSNDYGHNWAMSSISTQGLTNGVTYVAMAATGGAVVATVMTDGSAGVYYSSDHGQSYSKLNAAPSAGAGGVEWGGVACDATCNRIVAVGYLGQIYGSTDGGAHWTASGSALRWRGPSMSADGTRVVVGDTEGNLHYSTNFFPPYAPSARPTASPSARPTAPTAAPTAVPSAPSAIPTAIPTAPSAVPTFAPTAAPSAEPTAKPTSEAAAAADSTTVVIAAVAAGGGLLAILAGLYVFWKTRSAPALKEKGEKGDAGAAAPSLEEAAPGKLELVPVAATTAPSSPVRYSLLGSAAPEVTAAEVTAPTDVAPFVDDVTAHAV
jgi:hypothetical protein